MIDRLFRLSLENLPSYYSPDKLAFYPCVVGPYAESQDTLLLGPQVVSSQQDLFIDSLYRGLPGEITTSAGRFVIFEEFFVAMIVLPLEGLDFAGRAGTRFSLGFLSPLQGPQNVQQIAIWLKQVFAALRRFSVPVSDDSIPLGSVFQPLSEARSLRRFSWDLEAAIYALFSFAAATSDPWQRHRRRVLDWLYSLFLPRQFLPRWVLLPRSVEISEVMPEIVNHCAIGRGLTINPKTDAWILPLLEPNSIYRLASEAFIDASFDDNIVLLR